MVSAMLLRMVAYAPIMGIGGVIKAMQTGAGLGWVIAPVSYTHLHSVRKETKWND